jgi:TRAP-type C4-dicarboxylate transport system substrate-binding protein
MKTKILIGLLTVVLTLGIILSGCGPSTTTPPATTAAPPPTTTAAPPSTTAAPPAKVYEWKMQSFRPAGDTPYKISTKKLVDDLMAASKGRLKITLHASDALVPTMQMAQALGNNTIQMCEDTGPYIQTILPFAGVEFGLPMTWDTPQDTFDTWDMGMRDLAIKAYAEKGIHYTALEIPSPYLMVVSKPIKSLDELKGYKMRAVGSFADWATQMGMATVSMPIAELYMALKLGTADGFITGLDLIPALKLHEVCKYGIRPDPCGAPTNNILISMQAWNELPADLQATITKVSDDWSKWEAFTFLPSQEEGYYKELEKNGVTWTQLSAGDVARQVTAAKAVFDTWSKKDAYCAQAVQIIQDWMKKKGK